MRCTWASDLAARSTVTKGTATDRSNRLPRPYERKATVWSTLASMEFVVATRSERPPPSWESSCVNTAGIEPRLSPSRLSKPKCW